MGDEWKRVSVIVFLLFLTLGKPAQSFRVLSPLEARSLRLEPDNVELLQYAARFGSNETVNVRTLSQYVIAQHGAFLTFDCSSILPENPPNGTDIMWGMRTNNDEEFVPITPGVGDRIRINGSHNSLLQLYPTNIFVGGQKPDNGEYNCSVCRAYSDGDVPVCLSMDSRVTILVLIGSVPPPLHNRSCESFPGSYSCDINREVAIPLTTDPATGDRILDMDRLNLRCELTSPVVPTPNYSWTKDGINVVRDANHINQAMISDEFIMSGNNTYLLLIHPLPIMVTFDLIMIDFTAFNISSLPEGVVIADLRAFVLDIVLGEWSCNVGNVFGNVSATSRVFTDDDCSADECQNCLGLGSCVLSGKSCVCVCPPGGYDQSANCTDIDECLSAASNNCDMDSEECVNTDGGFNCICREGYIFNNFNQTCLDCNFEDNIENGRVEFEVLANGDIAAREMCDEGYVPEREDMMKICTIETNSNSGDISVSTTGVLQCSPRTTSDKNVFVIVIVVVVVAAILLLLIIFLIICCCCYCCCYRDWHHKYYPHKTKNIEEVIKMNSLSNS